MHYIKGESERTVALANRRIWHQLRCLVKQLCAQRCSSRHDEADMTIVTTLRRWVLRME